MNTPTCLTGDIYWHQTKFPPVDRRWPIASAIVIERSLDYLECRNHNYHYIS
jgi:hypothetical protein